jgi:Carboxypeptidase regulatory-like domain
MRHTNFSMIDMTYSAPRRLIAFAIFALLAAASASTLLAQQNLIATAADLPEAPSARLSQAPTRELPGTITGTVSDIRGGLISGAAITLTEKTHAAERKIVSDSEGNFTFTDVPPGSYTVVIASPGLETFQSPIILLRAGEKYELPNIALPIATASTTVDVVMTQSQVADEELKLETSQRVFAIFPNFYTSFLWNAAPLNTRQKFKLSFRATTDPVAFFTAGLVAGIEQANNTFPDYGQGAVGYGKRYGAAYGDAFIGRTLGSAVFPTIFRQDPRYFYMGPASPTRARLKHALLAGLVARGDNGRWQPNYSHIAGNAAAGALSSVYHPASNSAGSLAAANALIGIGGGAFQGLIREFLWDHFTSKVPSYAKGKVVAPSNP